jgi:hypothetical protein
MCARRAFGRRKRALGSVACIVMQQRRRARHDCRVWLDVHASHGRGGVVERSPLVGMVGI